MKNLIVYYSRKGENYWNGSVKNLAKGNTETVAEFIKEAVGGDLFEVETVTPYSEDYFTCTKQAKEELQTNARPQIKRVLESINEYDNVFVGYPNWWGTMPMAMFSFLEHYDLNGKTIVPFCTNEGSGMGRSERDIAEICPGSKVEKGLAVRGTAAASSETTVAEWAKNTVSGAHRQ